MYAPLRRRFWFEAGLVSVCGFLTVLTLFWAQWVEALTGLDPDHHNGSLEWVLVAGLAFACVSAGLAARHEWRRRRMIAVDSV